MSAEDIRRSPALGAIEDYAEVPEVRPPALGPGLPGAPERPMDAPSGAQARVKTHGVRVNSRAELVEYLRSYPLMLRAAHPSRPPRPGHCDFIGPMTPSALDRVGAINWDADGESCITIRKEAWERERDERLQRLFGP